MNPPYPTTLLVSSDSSLIESVRGTVASIPHLDFAVSAEPDAACSRLQGDEAALVMVHQPQEADLGATQRVLQVATAARVPIPTLVLSDRHHARQALTLLRMGAVDYLSRPLNLGRLACLLDMLTLRARYVAPRTGAPADVAELGEKDPFLYVRSTGMEEMMAQVRQVAPQETTLLLGGETGTGKTRLARLIHELSGRRDQLFLNVNCAALTPTLVESEMFGHVRGAFTGADRNRTGKFTDAGRGTLLLDEVDSLPLTLQAKLLRVVEERTFEAVGSNKTERLQARLIVASNRDLEEEVAAGRFRADLFYRLNVVGFHLPPLRERAEAVRPMTDRFVAEFAARNGRNVVGITEEAREALERHAWPGNIRELRNAIERAVALCPGTVIRLADLPRELRGAGEARPAARLTLPPISDDCTLADTKERAETERITQALQRNNNNRLRAAAELGVSRMTLYKKLHRYNLLDPL
jgi:two-component system response regulator HydG